MSDSEDSTADFAAAFIIAFSDERMRMKQRKKRRWWSLTIYRKRNEHGLSTLMQDLYMERTSGRLKTFLRMSPEDFEFLLSRISHRIQRKDTHLRKAISSKERLIITLRFLASGESYEDLSFLARVSPQAISKIVIDVCRHIVQYLGNLVKMPKTPEEWKAVAEGFQKETFFHHCIGAIDGRHMTVQCPINANSPYFNYKGRHSIVLLALCDSNYCFIYANVGAQGRTSDGGVFNVSSLAQKLETDALNLPPAEPLAPGRPPVPYVIVGDAAFGLKKNLMIPHAGNHDPGSKERIFNYRLSSARSRIENTFGIFTTVFRIFRKPMQLEPKKASAIVNCSVLLHNFLRQSTTSRNTYTPHGTFDHYEEVDGQLRFVRGSWRAEAEPTDSSLPLSAMGRRSGQSAKAIREEFGLFYQSDLGRVPWQDYLQ